MIEVRAALVLLGSAGAGAVTGALRLAAGASWPDAVLAAGAAFGGALGLLLVVVKGERAEED